MEKAINKKSEKIKGFDADSCQVIPYKDQISIVFKASNGKTFDCDYFCVYFSPENARRLGKKLLAVPPLDKSRGIPA